MISEEVLERLLKRVEETAKEVVELRKTVEQVATLLCLAESKVGETDIGRVIAEKIEEAARRAKIWDALHGRGRTKVGGGVEGKGVEKVEGSAGRIDGGPAGGADGVHGGIIANGGIEGKDERGA